MSNIIHTKKNKTTLKAIETSCDGYLFRSRPEVRWAIFLNALNIKFEYEKKGYQLDAGWYLPDFWLPDLKIWIEVKGGEPIQRDIDRLNELCLKSERLGIIVGSPWGIHNDEQWLFPFKGDVFYCLWSYLRDNPGKGVNNNNNNNNNNNTDIECKILFNYFGRLAFPNSSDGNIITGYSYDNFFHLLEQQLINKKLPEMSNMECNIHYSVFEPIQRQIQNNIKKVSLAAKQAHFEHGQNGAMV